MTEQQISQTRELTLQMIKIHDDAFELGFKSGKELLRQQNEELKNKLLSMRCEASEIAKLLESDWSHGKLFSNGSSAFRRLRKLAE